MKTIKYQIEFFSEWHCGSGLAAGADIDSLVIKDKNGLPFIPGKTIKGLLRSAVGELLLLQGTNEKYKSLFIQTFGYFNSKENADNPTASKGETFFTNAELPKEQRAFIVEKKLNGYLYRSIASTAIDEHGVAKDFSLRRMQTTVPCRLEGEILEVPEAFSEQLINGLKFIKRLGVNRNRGLGRCKITLLKGVEAI